MSRFRCYTCRRGSETEAEHVGHRCNRLRAWVVLQWRRFKVKLGLWSWDPPAGPADVTFVEGEEPRGWQGVPIRVARAVVYPACAVCHKPITRGQSYEGPALDVLTHVPRKHIECGGGEGRVLP